MQRCKEIYFLHFCVFATCDFGVENYEKVENGLVGAGGIAQAYAQLLMEQCCDLVAVADIREESASALARSSMAKATAITNSLQKRNSMQ